MLRTRTSALVLALLTSCTAGPERAESTMSEPSPAPTTATPSTTSATTSATTPAQDLEALALACDGEAIRRVLASADARLEGRSIRLIALWERARSFDGEGRLERAGVDELARALEVELGRPAPTWWIEQLASGRRHEGREPPAYDVGLAEGGDRRGKFVQGPGVTELRESAAMVVSSRGDRLTYDLSMGRMELGPLPTDLDATLELARPRAGTSVYWSSFSRGSGGFRFPLRAVDFHDGQRWQAEVCGPDRKLLAGLGHLTVEIVVLEPDTGAEPGEMRASSGATGIAVFTAESHGVALDVFDPGTGARVLAWSSDLWFARGS